MKVIYFTRLLDKIGSCVQAALVARQRSGLNTVAERCCGARMRVVDRSMDAEPKQKHQEQHTKLHPLLFWIFFHHLEKCSLSLLHILLLYFTQAEGRMARPSAWPHVTCPRSSKTILFSLHFPFRVLSSSTARTNCMACFRELPACTFLCLQAKTTQRKSRR